MTPQTQLAIVANLAAKCLQIPPQSVGHDVPLARLGLDSLGCVELAAAIEATLGLPVPEDVLVESTTVASLCAAIRDRAQVVRGPADRMAEDSQLPADIMPARPRGAVDLCRARVVLLTGVTGFLGSTLLPELIRRGAARVICLVRPTRLSASERLAQLTRELCVPAGRVDFVEGDLGIPRAGLSDRDWARLSATVDAVCHAGASISWVSSYDALRRVNVLATRDLVRLACEAGASFHFISSLSVCYSTNGPRSVDESFEAQHALDGLHLGYAQSKAVAETLVAQAAARGLRTRIYRPALIAADTRTGRCPADDLLTMVIEGCTRMGAAPDLDWRVDALPVNQVADAILRLSRHRTPVSHISHPRPYHWRECVLWMRLSGRDVRLVPYRDWAEQLRRDTEADADHPLRPLRAFFLDSTPAGVSLPELYEQSRCSHVDAARSRKRWRTSRGSKWPKGSTEPSVLLNRARSSADATRLARALLQDARLSAANMDVGPLATEDSIISELTTWRTGTVAGLFAVRAANREFVLKVKPDARVTLEVGAALAGLCGPRMRAAYEAWGAGLGILLGHAREIALYREPDEEFRRYLPRVFATRADAEAGTWAVLMERVRDAKLLDSTAHPERWRGRHVDAAIDGIAAIHARWHSRADELRGQPWIGTVRQTRGVIQMTPLWSALAEQAAPLFGRADRALPPLHRALVESVPVWRPLLDDVPTTLIHNDFNPRNVCLRRVEGRWRLCVFDWELATLGAPVRDVAELLCFVCPPDADWNVVERWIERHRAAFSARAGLVIERERWHAAFGAALRELLIDRLAMYALIDRVKPQPFLPRVLRTWLALHRMVERDAIAS